MRSMILHVAIVVLLGLALALVLMGNYSIAGQVEAKAIESKSIGSPTDTIPSVSLAADDYFSDIWLGNSCLNIETEPGSGPLDPNASRHKLQARVNNDCQVWSLTISNVEEYNLPHADEQMLYDQILDCILKKFQDHRSPPSYDNPEDVKKVLACKADVMRKNYNIDETFTTASSLTCPPFTVGQEVMVVVSTSSWSHEIPCEVLSCPANGTVTLNCVDRFRVPNDPNHMDYSYGYGMSIGSNGSVTTTGGPAGMNGATVVNVYGIN